MLVWILLLVYQLKHFLADYPLQGSYMLGKFKPTGWQLPLLAHASVHALFTLGICFVVNPSLWWLSIFDLVIHFTMDRIKASGKLLGRFKALSGPEFMALQNEMDEADGELWEALSNNPTEQGALFNIAVARGDVFKRYQEKHLSNRLFWWALGFDQMVHHLTHYTIIYFLVKGFLP